MLPHSPRALGGSQSRRDAQVALCETCDRMRGPIHEYCETRLRTNVSGLARAGVEALESLLRDALEHLLGEGAEQPPRDLKRLEDGAVLIRALREAAEAK